MKITKVEMIYPQEGPLIIEGENVPCIWVRIHTDEGITGLGETYPLSEAECGVIRGRLASMLIGQNPLEIERLWQDMFRLIGFHGWAGAELRAISAIDIALWDIYGKAAGQPIYQLLGGKSAIRSVHTTPAMIIATISTRLKTMKRENWQKNSSTVAFKR